MKNKAERVFSVIDLFYGVVSKMAWLVRLYVILIGLAWAILFNPTSRYATLLFGNVDAHIVDEFMESSNFVSYSLQIWFFSMLLYVMYGFFRLIVSSSTKVKKEHTMNILEAGIAVVVMLIPILGKMQISYIPVDLIVAVCVLMVCTRFVLMQVAKFKVLKTRHFGAWELREEPN